MNFLEIEKIRVELTAFLPRINGIPKILVLFSFYEKLLLTKNSNLIDAFAVEFINEYLTELDNYSPFYSEPKRTEQLVKQLAELKLIPILEIYSGKIDELISSINEKLKNFTLVLNGNTEETEKKNKLFFPLLGKVVTESEIFTYASVEPITIKITTAKHKDSFVFIPSHQKKEQLEEQARISFQVALSYLKDYKRKFYKCHELLIYFENLTADYDGSSLGIALTIGFIEQLSLLYNLPYLVNIKNNIASTGGLDKNGNVSLLGEEIIKKKVVAAFYSEIETLVIPEEDEFAAKEKLKELKEKYPNRKFNLVSVENLTDLLNRRNLIFIKKQSPVVRTAKNIRRHWKATTIVFALLAALIFNFWIDWDDNPARFSYKSNEINIENKNNKVLWNLEISINKNIPIRDPLLHNYIKLVDINSDGINEVIVANETPNALQNPEQLGRIACYNNKGIELWNYVFHDTISTYGEFINSSYASFLIDTTTINKTKVLAAYSTNRESFGSAIFFIDLKNGNRIGQTFWHPGFIIDGLMEDINNDNHKELVFAAKNNGFEKIAFGILNITDIEGKAPSINYYDYFKIRNANLLSYYLLPNSDFNLKFTNSRGADYLHGLVLSLNRNNKSILISASQSPINPSEDFTAGMYIHFKFFYETIKMEVTFGDPFRVARDRNVNAGKLNFPLTETSEYHKLLESQILSWNGKEFMKKEELK